LRSNPLSGWTLGDWGQVEQGAEGYAVPCVRNDNGKRDYLKVFTKPNQLRSTRTRWLAQSRLREKLPQPSAVPYHLVEQRWTREGVEYRFQGHIGSDLQGPTWRVIRRDVLAEKQWLPSIEERLSLVRSLFRTLLLLEDQGLIHGDLSPQNVVVLRSNSVCEVRLLDFDGFVHPDVPPMTWSKGGTLGTAGYQPPDLQPGESAFPIGDRYAASVLALEMLLCNATTPPEIPLTQWPKNQLETAIEPLWTTSGSAARDFVKLLATNVGPNLLEAQRHGFRDLVEALPSKPVPPHPNSCPPARPAPPPLTPKPVLPPLPIKPVPPPPPPKPTPSPQPPKPVRPATKPHFSEDHQWIISVWQTLAKFALPTSSDYTSIQHRRAEAIASHCKRDKDFWDREGKQIDDLRKRALKLLAGMRQVDRQRLLDVIAWTNTKDAQHLRDALASPGEARSTSSAAPIKAQKTPRQVSPPSPTATVPPIAAVKSPVERESHVATLNTLSVGQIPEGYVLIQPGRFFMGSPRSENGRCKDEEQHEVNIAHSFLMKETPVTQAEWLGLMGYNISFFKGCYRPVELVSWFDAVTYCNALSRAEGLEEVYVLTSVTGSPGKKDYGARVSWNGMRCTGYRLALESEWEYACRAGTTSERYGDLDEVAWWYGNSGGETHPVRQKSPNPWGLYDMLGNVWEWCHVEYYDYTGGYVNNPTSSGAHPRRVLRGGSWRRAARMVRAACRKSDSPKSRHSYCGFRVVRSISRPENHMV